MHHLRSTISLEDYHPEKGPKATKNPLKPPRTRLKTASTRTIKQQTHKTPNNQNLNSSVDIKNRSISIIFPKQYVPSTNAFQHKKPCLRRYKRPLTFFSILNTPKPTVAFVDFHPVLDKDLSFTYKPNKKRSKTSLKKYGIGYLRKSNPIRLENPSVLCMDSIKTPKSEPLKPNNCNRPSLSIAQLIDHKGSQCDYTSDEDSSEKFEDLLKPKLQYI
jgi:hypothetical protein